VNVGTQNVSRGSRNEDIKKCVTEILFMYLFAVYLKMND
jgi:hypothetical protein